MNFQVHIHFPQTFQMYFWTISSSSGVFKMMNLNRPSEFSALNFCFDPNGTLCSILNWNLLKFFLEHEFIERPNLPNASRKTSGSHCGIRNNLQFSEKVAKQGCLKRTHKSFHLTWLWKFQFYNLHWNPDFIKIYSVSKSLCWPRIPFLTLFHFFNISILAPTSHSQE